MNKLENLEQLTKRLWKEIDFNKAFIEQEMHDKIASALREFKDTTGMIEALSGYKKEPYRYKTALEFILKHLRMEEE